MTYQVLARKWRPQDFAGLVGQQHVVTALGNALAEERIAQAYLFSGIRGVGKTTAARVLAKALNCERGPAANPCNECTSCVEITSGHSLDVIEVDAATYSKVEQVRELTETLRYGPARGRYKVVVLDEVHRLSRQAFDALLKIVEEPPAHLVFIFATTEIDAVPATILSRCQEFQFRRVTQQVLADHLRQISEAENITVSDAALRMIARAGEGSVRDSVALLDQMATFGSGTIGDEDAQRILGGLDTAIFQKLLANLLASQRTEIVEIVREIEANGWDPHNVYAQFLGFLRDALHVTLGGAAGDLPDEEVTLLRKTVADHGYESLLQMLQLLISSEPTVRRSEFSLLALEIAWLRAAELPKVTLLQDLLSGGAVPGGAAGSGSGPGASGGGGPSRSGGVSASAGERTASIRPAAPRSISGTSQDWATAKAELGKIETHHSEAETARTETVKTETPKTETEKTELTTAPPSPEEPASDSLDACDPARLPEFLELLSTRRQSLAAHFEHAELRFEGRTLLISPPADDFLFTKALERQPNKEALDKALVRVWGEAVSWRVHGSAPKLGSAKPRVGPSPQANSQVQREPTNGTPSPATAPPGRRSAPNGSHEIGRPARPYEARPDPGPRDTGPPNTGPSNTGSYDAGTYDTGPGQDEPDWTVSDWRSSTGGSRVSAEEAASLSELPVVRTILSTFGGKIQSVEPVSKESTP